MKFWYLVWLAVMFLGMAAIYGLSLYVSEPTITVPFLAMMAGIHMFLAPIFLLTILNLEGKTQLWLYNPQGSIKLLLSKVSAAAIIQLITQVIISLYGLAVMKILVDGGVIEHFSHLLPFKQGVYMNLGIFATSMYISVWVIFLWTIYHSLGRFPAIRNFRWLAVILVWVAYNLVEALLVKLKILNNEMFSFGINVNIAPKMTYEDGWQIIYTDASLPIIIILFYATVSVVIFLLASWLLDRKVEV
ncbi:hypothetical protein ACFSCZ_13620 [Siminovitchia sediminis]|uniref:Uncharacterized protein n=1 Tax=Siminovitchia sediminis TaxID=1274353 RepID=A0ABW4KHZ4_9BACI